MGESAIVHTVAEQAAKAITRQVIAALRGMKDLLSGDDSELRTTWDEICVQLQYEKSFHWDAYDDTVRRIVETQIATLQKHEREAIWLQTEASIDWTGEDTQNQDIQPISDEDIVDWVTEEYVYAEAANWSNARIRAYIERSSTGD